MLGKITKSLTLGSLLLLNSCVTTHVDTAKPKWYEVSLAKDSFGKDIFSHGQAYRFHKSGYSLDYAKKLSNRGYSGFEIYRRAQMDLTLEETLNFTDTDRPDCVVLMTTKHNTPDDEMNKGGHYTYDHFNTGKACEFFIELQKHYDVWVEFVKNKGDIRDAMRKVAHPDLLILAGHGLSDGPGMSRSLDVDKDSEYFMKYVDKINQDGVLLLYSCLNAKEEGSFAYHCLDRLERKPGRFIYASKMSFSPNEFEVKSYYPLRVKFVETNMPLSTFNSSYMKVKDYTFTNREVEEEDSSDKTWTADLNITFDEFNVEDLEDNSGEILDSSFYFPAVDLRLDSNGDLHTEWKFTFEK